VIRALLLFSIIFILLDYSFAQTNADSSINNKDSIKKIKIESKKDTVTILKDSFSIYKTDSVIYRIQQIDIPGSFYLDEKTLTANPYFNFLGKRQIQLMQERHSSSKDYLFYLLFLLLLYFGLIKVLFEKYMNTFFLLFFRPSIRKQQIQEQLLQTPLPSLLLNILFFISAGLYCSFLDNYYHAAKQIEFPFLFAFCCTSILILYLLKFSLLKVCGWVFNITKTAETYIFIVFLVNKMTGILLLPFSIILAFSSNENIHEFTVTTSLIMIGLLFIYRLSAAYKQIRNQIKLSLFHFFIYICAFEITPVVLIYKVLLAYLEKAS
jgi:hypothetical protein